jgi:hypothetical protein
VRRALARLPPMRGGEVVPGDELLREEEEGAAERQN